jgi:hypothetical protein
MTFVNLTPHELNIHTKTEVVTLPPSGNVARISTIEIPGPEVGGIPTVATLFGDITGLPAPQEGVVLIVSGMVASAAPREDVMSPGPLVRDEAGRPVGCRGLRRS